MTLLKQRQCCSPSPYSLFYPILPSLTPFLLSCSLPPAILLWHGGLSFLSLYLLSPKWDSYITLPPPKTQGPLCKREQKGSKCQRQWMTKRELLPRHSRMAAHMNSHVCTRHVGAQARPHPSREMVEVRAGPIPSKGVFLTTNSCRERESQFSLRSVPWQVNYIPMKGHKSNTIRIAQTVLDGNDQQQKEDTFGWAHGRGRSERI